MYAMQLRQSSINNLKGLKCTIKSAVCRKEVEITLLKASSQYSPEPPEEDHEKLQKSR